MNLANGANEFFHTQISHVRALPILKSATRGCEPAARGFIGWHGYLKVLASVNIETAFGQISFKQLSQLDRHANENPLPITVPCLLLHHQSNKPSSYGTYLIS